MNPSEPGTDSISCLGSRVRLKAGLKISLPLDVPLPVDFHSQFARLTRSASIFSASRCGRNSASTASGSFSFKRACCSDLIDYDQLIYLSRYDS